MAHVLEADPLGDHLAVAHTAAGDLGAPLAELLRIYTQWSDFSMDVSSHFIFFSFFLPQLCPWGEQTRPPICTAERNKWHKTDLHCETPCDEGLACLI